MILTGQNSQNRRTTAGGNLTSNSTPYTGAQVGGATGGAVAGSEMEQHLPQLRMAQEKTQAPLGKHSPTCMQRFVECDRVQ